MSTGLPNCFYPPKVKTCRLPSTPRHKAWWALKWRPSPRSKKRPSRAQRHRDEVEAKFAVEAEVERAARSRPVVPVILSLLAGIYFGILHDPDKMVR